MNWSFPKADHHGIPAGYNFVYEVFGRKSNDTKKIPWEAAVVFSIVRSCDSDVLWVRIEKREKCRSWSETKTRIGAIVERHCLHTKRWEGGTREVPIDFSYQTNIVHKNISTPAIGISEA